MKNALLEEEQIERMFLELGKGNTRYFFELVSLFLDVLVEELHKFKNYQELLEVGLVSLFCAIKSYNREKQSTAIPYIHKYIHLSLLIHRENHTQIDASSIELTFPSYGIIISNLDFQQYLDEVKGKIVLEQPKKYIYN